MYVYNRKYAITFKNYSKLKSSMFRINLGNIFGVVTIVLFPSILMYS